MDEKTKSLSKAAFEKFQKQQYAEAVNDFQACIAEMEKSDEAAAVAEMKNNLCVALIYWGDPKAALDAASGTEKIFADAGDLKRQGMSYANQGNAFEALDQYDNAIAYYEKARDCLSACGEKKMLSITLRSLADLQLKTGRQYQAVATLQDSYEQNPEKKIKNKFFSTSLKKMMDKITGK